MARLLDGTSLAPSLVQKLLEGIHVNAIKSSNTGAIAIGIAALAAAILTHPRPASAQAQNDVNGTYAFTVQAIQ